MTENGSESSYQLLYDKIWDIDTYGYFHFD